MELSSHGEYCDFNNEKDLVNTFGGVAYDHDSMPKVVAVHTLSPEKLNNQDSPIIDRLPRNVIGIRSKPKKLRNLSIRRSFADLREQENSVKSSSFGLEQLSQRHSQHKNTVPVVTDAITTRELEKTSLPCNNTMKGCDSKPVLNLSSSCERIFQEQELGCGHMNKNVDYLKTSYAVTEVFSVAEKLSQPCEINTQSVMFSEDSNTKNGSLECLDWLSIGVLADKSSDELKLQLCSGKGLTAGCEETSSDTGATAGMPSQKKRMEGIDNQKQTRDCLIPRKRPRKSIPRKIDIKSEHFCSGSHSEKTRSTDEKTSELSTNKRTPVVSPNSSRSDSIYARGTKVIFRRTAGVWSVSSLISDVEANKASTRSSNRESDVDSDKQSKKICLFANKPIAPLVICDSLNSNCKEHCYSPALDREIRIKELKTKREKLLADVRQSRAASSRINLL